jgi:hypothetical protein
VFFTSRESDTLGQKGGIAVWKGGTQTVPKDYTGERVTDVASDLSWLWWTPYGICLDSSGLLYACGTDTNRSWVKSYEVFGNFAVEHEELPSLNSLSNADPAGAPMITPTDVALSSDESRAYVIDMDASRAFVFTRGTVGLETSYAQKERSFKLYANYPNPFNSKTVIWYDVKTYNDMSLNVDLSIYNSLGQKMATLVSGKQRPGTYRVVWNATDMPSGVYYYCIKSGTQTDVRKMALIR